MVIAHGPFFESRNYDLLSAAAPEDARRHHVLLRVTFEVALQRVTTDQGRGSDALSQDCEFLRAAHERFRKMEQSLPGVDIEIDTSDISATDVADRILTFLQGDPPGIPAT